MDNESISSISKSNEKYIILLTIILSELDITKRITQTRNFRKDGSWDGLRVILPKVLNHRGQLLANGKGEAGGFSDQLLETPTVVPKTDKAT